MPALRHQRGAVLVLVVVALLALLAVAALALDGGHMLVNKTRLQNAVDAAALSGAKTLSQVMGAANASTQVQAAALATLSLNAAASGNGELADAMAGNAGFATVELSNSVYGPFSFPGPANSRYVRVTVPNYPLAGFFWGILQATGAGTPDKAVAAVATAGPSPTSPCDLSPLMVCGDTAPGQNDPTNGLFWGYRFGDLELLKAAKNSTSGIGPGNFQLLDFGAGGKTVREELAGGGFLCPDIGNNVSTKPGNTAGPSVQGLNTRFGDYSGPLSAQDYPPDLVIDYNKLDNGKPALAPDLDTDAVSYTGPGGGVVSTDSSGNISTADGTALYDYNDWKSQVTGCVGNSSGAGCQSNGVFERRMLKIVIGQCTGTDGGTASVPVLGFGCFFVLQPMEQQGGQAWILGQFVRQCEGDNVPVSNPANALGPQIIQLYKTYIDNNQTPSGDS
ncbi:pilus assembly protein TadG-related protein [Pseudomonas sp. LFM046]|uniref:Tad domain-containing protein n=1 Tax=Pseudomonas sp. LFM046 TaxID=1608357 RepID=UPI001F5B4266|nr:pilus assembly protein TadG-related protein [Pseudomonas sp. LFM046]